MATYRAERTRRAHRRTTSTQRVINKAVGFKEPKTKKQRQAKYREIRKAFGLSTG